MKSAPGASELRPSRLAPLLPGRHAARRTRSEPRRTFPRPHPSHRRIRRTSRSRPALRSRQIAFDLGSKMVVATDCPIVHLRPLVLRPALPGFGVLASTFVATSVIYRMRSDLPTVMAGVVRRLLCKLRKCSVCHVGVVLVLIRDEISSGRVKQRTCIRRVKFAARLGACRRARHCRPRPRGASRAACP